MTAPDIFTNTIVTPLKIRRSELLIVPKQRRFTSAVRFMRIDGHAKKSHYS
jgi:hypothetical protein